MNIFEDLFWDNIETLVANQANQQPAVSWLLKTRRYVGIEEALAPRNVASRHFVESGGFEIRFEDAETNFDDELVSTLMGEEERQSLRNYESGYSGVKLMIETQVPKDLESPEHLPVIGAGGRIIVYQGTRGVTADVTVRQRSGTEEGDWRNPEEILSRLRREYSDGHPNLRLRGAYGYFELSKYEFQRFMRPVFLFSLEQPQDAERHLPGWRTTIVEPATRSLEFTLEEGLGSWVD